MKRLRVLMASAEDLVEPIFRKTIEDGGHHLEILNPCNREMEFIAEAKAGGYDVVIVTNLGLPLDYSLGFIAPLRQACSAKVIVMSGVEDRRKSSPRNSGAPFYKLPISAKQILDAVEEAAGIREFSR